MILFFLYSMIFFFLIIILTFFFSFIYCGISQENRTKIDPNTLNAEHILPVWCQNWFKLKLKTDSIVVPFQNVLFCVSVLVCRWRSSIQNFMLTFYRVFSLSRSSFLSYVSMFLLFVCCFSVFWLSSFPYTSADDG